MNVETVETKKASDVLRRAYEKPSVFTIGAVQEITLGASGGTSDMMGSNGGGKPM